MAPTHVVERDAIRQDPTLRIPLGSETVAATRFGPTATEGPNPALLMYVPYPKDDLITYGAYDPLVRYLARNGYEVVVANMLGTGGSTGHIEELFTRREGREPAAIVDWLGAQPWTTGKVGMFGKSYGGITALDAAAQRPDALEAIVPIHTPYQGYRNAYTHGGAFELLNIGINWLTLMQALDVRPPSRADDEAGWDAWADRLESIRRRDPWLFQFLDHDPADAYWNNKNIPVGEIDTPTLAVGGWRDSYTRDTIEYFEAIEAPKRLLLGPWRHTMPHRGREAAIDFRRRVVEWFDHFLRDRDTDALDRPSIQYWTETDGGGAVDGGVWRGRERWPRPDASAVRFVTAPSGLVSPDAFETGSVERSYEFDHTVGVASVPGGDTGVAPVDTTPDDRRSVRFETAALESPLELTGTGRVAVPLDASTTPHVFSARLVDVAPGGEGRLVAHATATRDGSDADGSATTLPLQPKSHVFGTGHRLRLALSAAHFPVTAPAGDHGEFTVRSTPEDPVSLVLPGRRLPEVAFDDTVEFESPDRSVAVSSPFLTAADSNWTVTREHPGDKVTVRKERELEVSPPHAESMRRIESSRATVEPNDPVSLNVENSLELLTDYGDKTVRVVAENRIGPPLTAVETRVEVGNTTVFDECWIR